MNFTPTYPRPRPPPLLRTTNGSKDVERAVLLSLKAQRETIIETRETLRGSERGIARALHTLARISRRMWRSKIALISIAGLLLAAIVVTLIYYIARSKT